MKKPVRIIPILDIKNGLLIKGINFEGLRVLGNAKDFAKLYFSHGADEICYQDSVATLYGTNNLIKFVTQSAKNVFKIFSRRNTKHQRCIINVKAGVQKLCLILL